MARKIRGRGEGSLSRRLNGRWRAQTSPINGQRISKTFTTKAEAQNWLRETQRETDNGFNYQGSKTLLKDYLLEWLETCQISLKPNTIIDYERTLHKHVFPYFGEIILKELSLQKVEKFYAHLVSCGIGARTVRLIHSILHKSLEKAVINGLLTHNPTAHAALPRYKHEEMKALDANQANLFLVAANDSPYKALYHLAIKTGMREGELFGLKWSDLSWHTGQICVQRQIQRVRGKGKIFQEPKTRSSRRTIQLGEGAIQVLRQHFEKQQYQKEFMGERWRENDLIFTSRIGTPMDAGNMLKDFKQILQKAGLPKIRFHDLRHTCASLMLNNGVPVIVVSKILGHSKPSITLDIYGHLYNEHQEGASRLIDELISPVTATIPANIPQE